MRDLWHRLGRLSYSRAWLIKASLVAAAVTMGLGLLTGPRQNGEVNEALITQSLYDAFASNPEEVTELYAALIRDHLRQRYASITNDKPVDAPRTLSILTEWGLLDAAHPSPNTDDKPDLDRLADEPWQPIAAALYDSAIQPANDDDLRGPNAALQKRIEQDPPARWSLYALGELHTQQNNLRPAAEAFEAEARAHPPHDSANQNDDSAQRAVEQYQRLKADTDLIRLSQDPLFAEHISPRVLQRVALREGRVLLSLRLIPAVWLNQVPMIPLGVYVITLISGGFWYLFALNYATPGSPGRGITEYLLLSAIAVFLGAFSTQVTLWFIILQDDLWGLSYDPRLHHPIRALIYHVFGVGLREELSKLLCFLPLVPYLAKQNRPALWLLTAGCVGLGFAIEENLFYVAGTQGGSLTARFITANFLHMTLTALIGYQAVRTFQKPKQEFDRLLQVFAIAFVAHGCYNAFGELFPNGEGAFFSMTVFILIGFQYFQLLRAESPTNQRRFSLTAVFVLGLAASMGGSYAYQAVVAGPFNALLLIGTEALGVAIICVMYFQQINERLEP